MALKRRFFKDIQIGNKDIKRYLKAFAKQTTKKTKRQPSEWEKIFAN